ncbi:MAG: class B sortase [Lachnospiraceae bacterium]|nr:class B sortase [Lachnospiraceae bacterium]
MAADKSMGSGKNTGKKKKRGKGIGTVIVVLLLCVFGFSIFKLFSYYLEYREQDKLYEEAVHTYIKELPASAEKTSDGETGSEDETGSESENEIVCPVAVDFDTLFAENKDAVGWLYCEDTNINYPVMQGEDNDYYLHHSYDGQVSKAGAIFAAAENSPGFTDSNTIIYGHHMKNGSMFAHLADWADQEYFDAHSVMWLLTPEETYRVDLFAGYLTSVDSAAYTIFTDPCPEFDKYLSEVLAASDVQTTVETPKDAHYVMLSTCEYNFQNARYVLFGVLRAI